MEYLASLYLKYDTFTGTILQLKFWLIEVIIESGVLQLPTIVF